MKLSSLCLTTLIVIVSFSSCKKNDSPQKPVCRIIAITRDAEAPIKITYNADGKIASCSDERNVRTFQYSNDTVIINETDLGVFKSRSFVTLNEHGLATNVRLEANESGTDWYNSGYEYNGKELVKETITTSGAEPPWVTTFTWANGNPISDNQGGIGLTAFDYYTDMSSQAGDYLQMPQLTKGYYITAPRNAIKSIIYSGSITNVVYKTDSDGKITSAIVGDPPNAVTYSYTYQCN